jgi:hypothetical protein
MTVMRTRERSHLICELETRQIPTQRSRSVLAATAVATVAAPSEDIELIDFPDEPEPLAIYDEPEEWYSEDEDLDGYQSDADPEIDDYFTDSYGVTSRQLLGFDNTRRGRRMSFLDTDDDEHDLLGSLGMHIVTI